MGYFSLGHYKYESISKIDKPYQQTFQDKLYLFKAKKLSHSIVSKSERKEKKYRSYISVNWTLLPEGAEKVNKAYFK